MLNRVKKQWRKYHLKFAYCLNDIRFKPLNVFYLQLVEAYISKKMIDLCKCNLYVFWQ